MLSTCDVVLPAVPGTCDHATGQFTFPDRTTGVSADSVDGVNRALHVEKSDNPAASCDLDASASRNILGVGQSDFRTHEMHRAWFG